MTSTIRATTSWSALIVVVRLVLRGTGSALRIFLVQIAQDLLDAILIGDRFIESEFEFGHPPQAQLAADMPAEERRRTLERLRRLLARRSIAHRRVEHACLLKVGRDLDAGERDE